MKCIAALLFIPVAVFSQAQYVTGQAARAVIGQPNFTAQHYAGSPPDVVTSASLLGGVGGLAWANGTLFAVDSNRVQAQPIQNRVLVYNNLPLPGPTDEIAELYVRCPVCVGTANVVVGQPDFTTVLNNLTQTGLNSPTGVASDGHILAVADTDNNRVLIWSPIPTTNGAPATVVLGQKDFSSVQLATIVSSSSLRGPEGVWIQGQQLFVADSGANRVLIWNHIPTQNGQAADIVLGQSSFTSAPDNPPTTAQSMFSPVSVTSDGTRLYVTDLGNNRVLIWNHIPTTNGQTADIELGQPDFKSNASNNTAGICPSTGSGSSAVYPALCGASLSFPRFALSDGTRLYVADGGNDRVLVYNSIPTANAARAQVVLGQQDEFSNVNGVDTTLIASSAQVSSPQSLAWDGTNLYVSDPWDLRVMVFTPGQNLISNTAITNSASNNVFALGSVVFGGTINAGDTVTVTINGTAYTYTVLKADTLTTVIAAVTKQIDSSNNGAGDPNVEAINDSTNSDIVLVAKVSGANGNYVAYSAAASSTAQITATAGGANLAGGQNAADVAPGTLISVFGYGSLTDQGPAAAPAGKDLPLQLAGVELYVDGMRAPLQYVSDKQINAQLPFEVADATSVTTWVRSVKKNGTVINTAAVAVPVTTGAPGIFAKPGSEPRAAIATHGSSYGTDVVSVDGTITAGNTATITIGSTAYTYTVTATDTLTTVENALMTMINADKNQVATAEASGAYNRIILTSKVKGAAGNGIAIAVSTSASSTVLLTILGNTTTCCANTAGALLTASNPAVPGEIISLYATGLGIAASSNGTWQGFTGKILPANSPANTVLNAVDALVNGNSTANVLFAGLEPGTVGIYLVQIQLSNSLTTNLQSQLRIAQGTFTSNIVAIPVQAP